MRPSNDNPHCTCSSVGCDVSCPLHGTRATYPETVASVDAFLAGLEAENAIAGDLSGSGASDDVAAVQTRTSGSDGQEIAATGLPVSEQTSEFASIEFRNASADYPTLFGNSGTAAMEFVQLCESKPCWMPTAVWMILEAGRLRGYVASEVSDESPVLEVSRA